MDATAIDLAFSFAFVCLRTPYVPCRLTVMSFGHPLLLEWMKAPYSAGVSFRPSSATRCQIFATRNHYNRNRNRPIGVAWCAPERNEETKILHFWHHFELSGGHSLCI